MAAPLVLVVDDELLISLDLCYLAQELGCETVCASCAEEALAACEDHAFDLAIVDLNLGAGMDGLSLARRLRERFGVRSVVVSASLTESIDRQAADVATATFEKPYEPADLQAAIRSAVSREARA
jgi:CheY-like chemotaxis protein